MFVNTEQIHKGLHSYIDKELVAKAGQGKKFLILLGEPLIKGTVNNYIETYSTKCQREVLSQCMEQILTELM